MAPVTAKEILVYFQQTTIDMLIPKQRGGGFKMVPLGHHHCPLSMLAYQIGFDLFGLDGALEVQTGWISPGSEKRLINQAVRPIAELLGFSWRVVTRTEYYANHPRVTVRVSN